MLVGGGCSADCCSGGIRNSAEKGISRGANYQVLLRRYSKYAKKGISRGANCLVFAPAVYEIRRVPRVFFYRFVHFPVVMVRVATLLIYLTKNPPNRIAQEQKLLCGKSTSKRKSRAIVHPDGRHFEIIRV
jgi:hypothetical protein